MNSNMRNGTELGDTFFTIAEPVEGLIKERSSKFHYFAFPVQTEEEVKVHLAKLRKTFFDARHHCFAWVLGKKGEFHRAFDDGEPNHSAGDPILGQIRSKELTQVLIVVVRYFGGTKLGMSGLIQAYKTAASLALQEATIIEKQIKMDVSILFPYASMNEVMKLVKTLELEIVSQKMEMDCTMLLEFREGIKDLVFAGLAEVKDLILVKP